MRSIGIDIGDYSIKVVELIQNKKSIAVNQVHEKILNLNSTDQDREIEAIEFIRGLVSSQDFSNTRFVMAVRQDKVTSRHKIFPFSDRVKIQKSLSFEMEEDIPFDTDACIFEAKLIRTQGPAAEILANAVPKRHLESLISLAADFGIELHLISIEGLAFANLIEAWDQAVPSAPADFIIEDEVKTRKKIQIVLNIGHKKTLFTAFENNRLIFTRSLFWGGDQLIQDIIKRFQVPAADAVKTLQTQGQLLLSKKGASFEQSQLSDILSKSLRELVRDLQMSLLELQSEHHAEATDIYLTGGVSLLQNLGGFLTQHLEIKCNPVPLLQNHIDSFTALGLSADQGTDARFNLAVAYALEAYKKPRNPATNLLKGDFAKQNDQLKIMWMRWGAIAKVAGASLVVLFFWAAFREVFSTDLLEKGDVALKAQATKVARLPRGQANEAGVKKYIRENKKKATELKLIAQVAKLNSALEVLKKISESAPGREQLKIDIMNFQVKDDSVQIIGYATTQKDVDLFSQSLKRISTDGQVVLQPATLTNVPNRTAFNLTFKTDRGLVK